MRSDNREILRFAQDDRGFAQDGRDLARDARGSARILDNNRGITLIELVVVITIIALFATVVGTQVLGRVHQAKVAAAKQQISIFESALAQYRADNDFFPTTEQGIEALIAIPTVGRIPHNWNPDGYLDKKFVPLDPWRHPYVYICEDGEHYVIISYGAGGQEGGEGKEADISSEDLSRGNTP